MRSARLTAFRTHGRRITTVTFSAATMLGILTAPAHASSWSSHLSGAVGFESRRWYDSGGTNKINFTGCSDNGSNRLVNVTLRKDVTGPDPSYTKAAITNCFTSTSATSSGSWADHGSGNYYFVVNDGATSLRVWVKSLTVSY